MSLSSELRRRRQQQQQKAAGYGEVPLRLASEAGETLAERTAIKAEEGGNIQDLPAMLIRPTVESKITNTVADLVESGQIRPQQAKQTVKALMAQVEPALKAKEQEVYRQEAKRRVSAPSTLGGAAVGIGVSTALPWALSRGSWLLGKRPVNPQSVGEAFKFNFVPAVLPWAAGFEGITHLTAPFSDPAFKHKDRGYLKSVAESVRGARDGLAESGAEARARYGPLAMPIQAFHGIMNPLTSLAYLGQQIGGAFKTPDYEAWAREAVARRNAMQGGPES